MYVFDYGATGGFNLAVANPERITAIVTQNGNAYEEGLGAGPWAPLRAYWKQPSAAIRESIKERMPFDGVRPSYFKASAIPRDDEGALPRSFREVIAIDLLAVEHYIHGVSVDANRAAAATCICIRCQKHIVDVVVGFVMITRFDPSAPQIGCCDVEGDEVVL